MLTASWILRKPRAEETQEAADLAFPFLFRFLDQSTGDLVGLMNPRGILLDKDLSSKMMDEVQFFDLKIKNPLEAYCSYIWILHSCTPVGEAEWVYFLKNLKESLEWNFKELPPRFSQILPLRKLAPHTRALLGSLNSAKLPYSFIEECFDRDWSPAPFELLCTLDNDIQEIWLQKIKKLKPSLQWARESLELGSQIQTRFGTDALGKLLAIPHESWDEFRHSARLMANPEWERLSKIRLDRLRALHLPPRTAVFADPSFESDVLKITHQPKNLSDLETFKDWINDPKMAAKLQELLDLYQ